MTTVPQELTPLDEIILPPGVDKIVTPPGLEIVRGMGDIDGTMRSFGLHILDTMRTTQTNFSMLVAHMGGNVPAYYVLSLAAAHDPELFQYLQDRTSFVSTRKAGNQATLTALGCSPIPKSDTIFCPEDIIDEGGTAQVIEEAYPENNIVIIAPFEKPESRAVTNGRLRRSTAYGVNEIPDVWVTGGGMDSGAPKLAVAPDDITKARLAALQRFCRVGVHYTGDVDYETQSAFFKANLLPWIKETDPLFNYMWRMEYMKMTGDERTMKRLSDEFFPIMLDHIENYPLTTQ